MNTTAKLTAKAIPAPHIDAPTMWERNAKIVIVEQDGNEIGREIMYPNKGETVEGILAFFKNLN
ncbi:hypothetical protein SEA_PSONYX_116 [Corynebacterium phage PSonyx]|nr:hypothetical protein SEA_PSONYX_116 [Corynebacterium phage PSonyx]